MKVKELKTKLFKLSAFIIIRYLYLILTNTILKDLWYTGSGSYGISFNLLKDVVAGLVFLLVSFYYLSIKKKSTFIDVFLELLFVLYFIPMNCAFALNDMNYLFLLLSSLYYLLLLILIKRFIKPKKPVVVTEEEMDKKKTLALFDNLSVKIVCTVICLLCIAYKISYNGFSISFSLGADEVYANRGEFQANLDAISGSIMAYVFTLIYQLATYVGPIYLLASVIKKNIVGIFVSFACVLSLFSMSSGKGDLFFLGIILFIIILYKTFGLKRFSLLFLCGMIVLLIGCFVEQLVLHSTNLYIVIVRRVMYLPAWLNTMYYDFFITHDKVMWTQSVFLLQRIFTPVYELSPLELISNNYFRGQIPSPNTGMFAEAIMHFGAIGAFVYPILITLMLKVSTKVYGKHEEFIACAVAIKLMLQVTNVSIVRTDFILSFVLFTVLMWLLSKIRVKW